MNETAQARTAYKFLLRSALARLGRDQTGATALEYALMGAFTSIAIIGGLTALGTAVNQEWNWVSNVVSTAMGH